MESSHKDQGKKNIPQVQTFTIPFPLGEKKENITINTNMPSKPSKEQIIDQAIQLHLKGNIPEAAKLYQYCITQDFKDHRIFSNYGAVLQGLGKSKEAELSFRKAIEIKPDFAETHYKLGSILKNLGKLQEAELSTRKAIEINPNYAEAHSNLGSIFRGLGKLKEAELSYRKAIEINPDFANYHYNLGRILIDFSKFKEAELSTRKAIELNPNFEIAHVNLGKMLLRKGNHIEGIKHLKEGAGFIKFDLINGLSIN